MLSLVLPTYNESQNVQSLLVGLRDVLQDLSYEIIIVDDDSPDETWRTARELSQHNDHVRVIRRVGRRGLSSAVVEGFLASKGDVFVVMDADGQHDASLVSQLYTAVRDGAQIAIGSRYVDGGSVGNWDERRYALSRLATNMAIRLCAVPVADPMSGFFAIDRATFESALPHLNPKGFKILLDFLVHIPRDTHVVEIPFTFRERLHGESKLSRRVQIEFLEYLYDVTLGRTIPLTFAKYCIVGTLGVFVHVLAFVSLSYLFRLLSYSSDATFSFALLGAIEMAIIFNFLLNNVWTFGLQRLRGIAAVWGFFSFNLACGVGALANYGTSKFLYGLMLPEMLCVLIGAFVGVFWNYTMNRMMTWKA